MARFLIEVPHSSEAAACWRAIHALLATGSHYITHADWGCLDGEHKAWLTVDVDSRDDAGRIVPPAFRNEAKIVQLCRFSLREAEQMVRSHRGERPLSISVSPNAMPTAWSASGPGAGWISGSR